MEATAAARNKSILHLLMPSPVRYLLPVVFACSFLACHGQPEKPTHTSNAQQAHPPPSTIGKIKVPEDYRRLSLQTGSYAAFLRQLKLKPNDTIVNLYDGSRKGYQQAQYAILSLDAGDRDLQQCADAVMRFRGEYLFAQKQYGAIHFNFLSDGKPRYFVNYTNKRDYASFRKYMDYIFAYANTASLKQELPHIPDTSAIQPGDVFIERGHPIGHAVNVMDVAIHKHTGKRIFLLAQSYMPAQEIHILKNPQNPALSPWYKHRPNRPLITPEWRFPVNSRHRFPQEDE